MLIKLRNLDPSLRVAIYKVTAFDWKTKCLVPKLPLTAISDIFLIFQIFANATICKYLKLIFMHLTILSKKHPFNHFHLCFFPTISFLFIEVLYTFLFQLAIVLSNFVKPSVFGICERFTCTYTYMHNCSCVFSIFLLQTYYNLSDFFFLCATFPSDCTKKNPSLSSKGFYHLKL